MSSNFSTSTDKPPSFNPGWTWAVPTAAAVFLGLYLLAPQMPGLVLLLTLGLVGSVVTSVHHAEVIALKVGEPFGTLVLALSITIIEVALIVSMMLSGGEGAMGLPRDTLFAAVMIILNGIIGFSLVAGGRVNRIQKFNLEGTTDALCTLTIIVVVAMVLPNYVTAEPGPIYSAKQLVFAALVTLVLFAAFTVFQTMGHREYFLQPVVPGQAPASAEKAAKPSARTAWISLGWLIVSLVCVVGSAKAISPTLEALLGRWGAPAAALGIVIAAIVLMPEFGAALRAARANRLQSSLNLAMGSAIASVGLTVPTVSLFAVYMGWPLELGLDAFSTVMLVVSLFLAALTLRTGYTTLQAGLVHVVLFVVYLFFSFVP